MWIVGGGGGGGVGMEEQERMIGIWGQRKKEDKNNKPMK